MDNPVTAFLTSAAGGFTIWFVFFWGKSCEDELTDRFGIRLPQHRDDKVAPDAVCTNVLGMEGTAVGRIGLDEAGVLAIFLGLVVGGVVAWHRAATST